MSVALTEDAVVNRSKTVTRRLGWKMLKPGDRLTLCRKVMGRRKGEPLVRLAEVEVVAASAEPLSWITDAEVRREGFEDFTRAEFVAFFCEHMKVAPDDEVQRIEWRYLDSETEAAVKVWNETHSIGTPVRYWPGVMEGPGVESVVRSEAWIMPSGHAVAKVEGYAGGIALTHIGYRDAEQAAKAEEIRDEMETEQS
jgi:hypothetical protein